MIGRPAPFAGERERGVTNRLLLVGYCSGRTFVVLRLSSKGEGILASSVPRLTVAMDLMTQSSKLWWRASPNRTRMSSALPEKRKWVWEAGLRLSVRALYRDLYYTDVTKALGVLLTARAIRELWFPAPQSVGRRSAKPAAPAGTGFQWLERSCRRERLPGGLFLG
jgi:hypothetical protein